MGTPQHAHGKHGWDRRCQVGRFPAASQLADCFGCWHGLEPCSLKQLKSKHPTYPPEQAKGMGERGVDREAVSRE